jgi:hypothetical protein
MAESSLSNDDRGLSSQLCPKASLPETDGELWSLRSWDPDLPSLYWLLTMHLISPPSASLPLSLNSTRLLATVKLLSAYRARFNVLLPSVLVFPAFTTSSRESLMSLESNNDVGFERKRVTVNFRGSSCAQTARPSDEETTFFETPLFFDPLDHLTQTNFPARDS